MTVHVLIFTGDLFKPTKIYFTMDETVLGTADDLSHGVGLLFGSYYVYNLEYDPMAQITLEFIQR